jgi:LPPG:FO 2-phospho-L-lactate transferase
MRVVALAGGTGAGKFLRGLVRAVPPEEVTVVVNTADDLDLFGLRICPDLDSVLYWLSGLADRERGWGREGETFRALDEVRRLGGPGWFNLGDLDLGTHLARTQWLREGATLSAATDRLRQAAGVTARLLPMTDDRVETWITATDEHGRRVEEPFQVYWVARGARDDVRSVTFVGAEDAKPATGVLDAIADADVVLFCPSNPIVSILPILSVPGVRAAIRERERGAVGVSPIVGGAPVSGMLHRLMPAFGWDVTAEHAVLPYRGLLDGWVIDERDAQLADAIRSGSGVRVSVTDTLMVDDEAAERVARAALDLAAR